MMSSMVQVKNGRSARAGLAVLVLFLALGPLIHTHPVAAWHGDSRPGSSAEELRFCTLCAFGISAIASAMIVATAPALCTDLLAVTRYTDLSMRARQASSSRGPPFH